MFFSQEFKEIIRQRFPFLNVTQIMNAVKYRWNSLNKQQKAPFLELQAEDKTRHDKECTEFKKGTYSSRANSSQSKLQLSGELSIGFASALEISEDLLKFL